MLYLATMIGGASLSALFSILGKYLGECSTNGPIGKFFTIVYTGMGLATF